jgi:NAD(P)-dependent dehydrogenase (short-subunit alcohol dehydrogenase family)
VRTTRWPGGTRTDLRSLPGLGQDDRSHCTDSAWEERVRASGPLQMTLEPADLARASVLLASRANARGITGAIVTVDAGVTLRMPRRT